MTNFEQAPKRVIGRRGLKPFDPTKHARFKTAEEYGFVYPEPTYPIDKSGGVTEFGMGGNGPDQTLTVNGGQDCGDCGPNAVPKNVNITTAALGALQYTAMTSNEIVTLYFTYQAILVGIEWRPVGDNWVAPEGLDQGVDLGDWLLWLFQQGLIEAFVKVPLNQRDKALATTDCVVVGVILNTNADEQAENNQPWSVGPGDEPDPEDGHAIQLLASAGAVSGLRKYATWGMAQEATYDWDQVCPQQAFAVLTKEQALSKNFPFDAVVADLKALGGTAVVSAPALPEPEPAPPGPELAPETFLQQMEGEVKDVVEDVEKVIGNVETWYRSRESLSKAPARPDE
jgi:hypothetical protein